MKFSFIISLLTGLVGEVGTANASPITYIINFSGGSPNPTYGQFTYDSGAALGNQFSAFTVEWNALSFNLTASANNPFDIPLGGFGCTNVPTSATFFALLNGTPQCSPSLGRRWGGQQVRICRHSAYKNAIVHQVPIEVVMLRPRLSTEGAYFLRTPATSLSPKRFPSPAL